MLDFLIGLAWIAIVLIPVFVAYRQPVVSHNGYVDNYMNSGGQGAPGSTPLAGSGEES